MPLRIRAGQFSDAGRKPENQDFHGLCVPTGTQLASKGVAVALADGISSSAFAREAAQAAVGSFLDDYYCTSEAWSVKTSAERVLAAANSWLFAQTQGGLGRYDRDRGWACTLAAMVLKARTAHLFHVGDTRIYQVQGRALEPLTQDHRVYIGGGQSYLARAFGTQARLEIDYRAVPLAEGDTFLLLTDGVYEHLSERELLATLAAHGTDLDGAARAIALQAVDAGSPDNVTVQVLRVESLPLPEAGEVQQLSAQLPLPPLLEPRMVLDGWRIVRELHASSRSHIHLAVDESSGEAVAIKTPSLDLRDDPAYRERFLLEEWVARRADSAHLLQARAPGRERTALYTVMEFVDGCTLRQWMRDHPRPGLAAVRTIVDQLARGLRALHRLEMVHQDLRPENVMIDATGTVKIIDFGATRVAGLVELAGEDTAALLGTEQYSAPEALLGAPSGPGADLYSLAVIAYELLGGQLPYGTQMARCRTAEEQRRVPYRTLLDARPDLPSWVDDTLQKALQADPLRRHGDVSEFASALHQPEPGFVQRRRRPLIERNPLVFWKGLALLLAVAWLATFALLR